MGFKYIIKREVNFVYYLCIMVLGVNADKSKYMVRSREQNEGGRHSVKIDNNFFEKCGKV